MFVQVNPFPTRIPDIRLKHQSSELADMMVQQLNATTVRSTLIACGNEVFLPQKGVRGGPFLGM